MSLRSWWTKLMEEAAEAAEAKAAKPPVKKGMFRQMVDPDSWVHPVKYGREQTALQAQADWDKFVATFPLVFSEQTTDGKCKCGGTQFRNGFRWYAAAVNPADPSGRRVETVDCVTCGTIYRQG